jgi:hypothetical protein
MRTFSRTRTCSREREIEGGGEERGVGGGDLRAETRELSGAKQGDVAIAHELKALAFIALVHATRAQIYRGAQREEAHAPNAVTHTHAHTHTHTHTRSRVMPSPCVCTHVRMCLDA